MIDSTQGDLLQGQILRDYEYAFFNSKSDKADKISEQSRLGIVPAILASLSLLTKR
jgi:hypothetical protein